MAIALPPDELYLCVLYAKNKAMLKTPIVTGNLRYNSLRIERVGKYDFKVFFDKKIAPYADKTNQPGMKNGGWFEDRFIPTFVEELEKALVAGGYKLGKNRNDSKDDRGSSE